MALAACTDEAPLPDGAVASYALQDFADPAAFDDVFAEAERAVADDVIVIADIPTCARPTVWALPQPGEVVVRYRIDDVDCAAEANHRAIFLIDTIGTFGGVSWDYTDAQPTVRVEPAP